MASFFFTCVSCLGLHRLQGRTEAPPDFDNLCETCRPQATAAAKQAERKPTPARGQPRDKGVT